MADGGERFSGAALGSIAAGSLLVFAGIKGYSLAQTVQDVIKGTSPLQQTQTTPIAGTAAAAGGSTESGTAAQQLTLSTPGGGSHAQNQALGRLMAGGYGWATGQDWKALDYGWGTLESGWNNQIYNGGQVGGAYEPGRAYGIPQANGHGPGGAPYPAGNAGNPPGAGGTSSAVAQIAWGLAYIKGSYGSPANVPGWLGQGGYVGY